MIYPFCGVWIIDVSSDMVDSKLSCRSIGVMGVVGDPNGNCLSFPAKLANLAAAAIDDTITRFPISHKITS